ncbi:hypothetical protein GGI18_000052 [Coemansia linderi]|uniref:Uncharacterized protein n=1 Tax=Coemansia linderi TaxID=2663919 RepID=A0ACC1KPN3_9FUNG|nr:hypothetical protein GGI18_000052 [Coemansia linderi]
MPTAEAFLGVLPFNLKGTSSPIPRRRNPNQGSSINDRFSRLFKHRGSRVAQADVEQQRTRVDRQQSTEILLQNDFAMARLLCKLDVSGDKAATMASHLISFLRGNPKTADHVETFVMAAFDAHLSKYAAMSSNPRNVLRDNNLATMLVVCYLQQTCRSYLVSILQPVMSAIAPYVESCELDPMRFAQDIDPCTSSRNLYNLYCVCRSVLDAVFSAGKHAPVEMRRLCALIRGRIEAAWGMNLPASLAPAAAPTPSAPKPAVDRQLPILELRDWENDLKSTVQTDIMSDIRTTLDKWLDRRESAMSSSPGSARVSSGVLKDTEGQPRGDGIFAKLVSSSFAGSSKVDNVSALSSKAEDGHRSPLAPAADDPKETWRMTQNLRKSKSPVESMRLDKHASRRYSGSYFTPVETVISMLIFVRFFIPILTAPDTYGLDVNMSPDNRRGLLLCAKFVAVLCNGVSFGAKVPYLVPMNGLLREYRPRLRHYLHTISSNTHSSTTAATPSADANSDADHVSDDEESDGDVVTIDELVSQFQVITMSAQIGTKEEQRKSRMSLSRAMQMNAAMFATDMAGINGEPFPPVPPLPLLPALTEAPPPLPALPIPPPLTTLPVPPPLPPRPRHAQYAPRPQPRSSLETDEYVVPASRATIDLPLPRSNIPATPSSAAAIAVASSASDSLLDSETVDERLVTIDFLLCLEGNYAKLEALVGERAAAGDSLEAQLLQNACRELKPIVHYAKHLSSPSRAAGTAHIPSGIPASQEQGWRFAFPFGSQNTAARTSEEYEDLGRHRRTTTLPENYKF